MRYNHLYESGELTERAERLYQSLSSCSLCPHKCEVNRLKNELGFCGAGERAIVASSSPHYGEEPPLVGSGGSGTIFFAHCNLQCVYCQNYAISFLGQGAEVTFLDLAHRMLSLQERGCANINFVTPSHVVPQIVKALEIAIPKGLHLPLVYNSGGYDSVAVLKELQGIISIYMPDIKYVSEERALKYSGVENYPTIVKGALKEMYRQVGDLVIERGLAKQGLIVRHLALPNGLEDTRAILSFIAEELSPRTYLNLLDQYYPAHRAGEHLELKKPLSHSAYREVLRIAQRLGLNNLANS